MKRPLRLCLSLGFATLCTAPVVAFAQVGSVSATVETVPVANSGDAADDPAIWVHPSDTGLSVVYGTNKLGGIGVYSLDGSELQYLPDGDLNNIDVRYGFDFGGTPTDIAVVGNRTGDIAAIYAISPADGTLTSIAGDKVDTGLTVYGTCLYQSRVDGSVYVFFNEKSGDVIQHRLVVEGDVVNLEQVRQLNVPTQVEGCVADDDNAAFYLGEEDEGIWKFGAEPGDPVDGTMIASVGDRLTADVEGLAIFETPDGGGYLVASSQGNNTYVAFDRAAPHAWIASFEIVDGGGIDGTSDTDGIDVISTGLGTAFPDGLFVAQDGTNPGDNQNFKFVSWGDVAAETGLLVASDFDPRASEPVTPGGDAGSEPDAGEGADVGELSDGGSSGDNNSAVDAGNTDGAPDTGGNTANPISGGGGDDDGSGDELAGTESGCSCAQAQATPSSLLPLLLGLVLLRLPRRRLGR